MPELLAVSAARRQALWRLAGWGVAAPVACLAWPGAAWAGRQLEEPLADSVRTALSSAIANSAPPEPQFATTDARMHYLRWMGAMSNRLRRRKPDSLRIIHSLRHVIQQVIESFVEMLHRPANFV